MLKNKQTTVGQIKNWAELNLNETLLVIAQALSQAMPHLPKDSANYGVLHGKAWDCAVELNKGSWRDEREYYGTLNIRIRQRAYWWLKEERLIKSDSAEILSLDSSVHDNEDEGEQAHGFYHPNLTVQPEEPREAENIAALLVELLERAAVPLLERVALLYWLSQPGRKNANRVAKGTWEAEWVEIDGMWAFRGVVSVRLLPGEDPTEATARMQAIRRLFHDEDTDTWGLAVDRKQITRYCEYAQRKLKEVV